MTVTERITIYIGQLCEQIGVSPDKVYNPKTNAWYFTNGSATMEVFLTSQKSWDQQSYTYLRCMSPLCEIPKDIKSQFNLYKTVLAINSAYSGFKISADEERGILCIVAERDIRGMDYEEMVTMIDFLGHWANKLDDFMKAEFPAA